MDVEQEKRTMIVREIVNDFNMIYDFDWFNDYKDTRLYIEECGRRDLLKTFDEMFEDWKTQNGKYKTSNSFT
jgi:hypothetical protein